MKRSRYQVIRRPLVTEKNTHRIDTRNQYTFEVDPAANKVEIRQAIESLFDVKVASVNTVNVMGKRKRHGWNWHVTGGMKKAIVTLKEGKIEII